MSKPRVLITDAEERSMLAVSRQLHSAGYEVTAASPTALAAAQWSRSCSRRLRVADARADSDRFVEQLGEELTRRPCETVIAGSDRTLLAISSRRERIERLTSLGLPSAPIVERALHRESLARAALQVGLHSPASIRCADPAQALAAAHELGFPVAVKSIRAARADGRAVEAAPKGQVLSTAAELSAVAEGFRDGLLVQRWVSGELVSFGGVFADGSLLGVVTSRYRRMWPPESGSVSFGETISPPPGLQDMVRQLMLAIGWEGIFELELIQTGPAEFVPIDFNPRPYGSMALAAAAGVPLATIWCDWLLGRPSRVAPADGERSGGRYALAGERYRWEDGDLRHTAWQLRRGHLRSALEPMRPRGRVTHAHFRASDPLPLLARGLYLGRRLFAERSAERTERTGERAGGATDSAGDRRSARGDRHEH